MQRFSEQNVDSQRLLQRIQKLGVMHKDWPKQRSRLPAEETLMEAVNTLKFFQSIDSDPCIDERGSKGIGVINVDARLTKVQDGAPNRDKEIAYAAARSALSRAQSDRDTHKAARDRILDAVDRAISLSAAIERKLARFAKLDKLIAEECANTLLRATEEGASIAFEWPSKMKRLAEKKFAFENQLNAYRRGLDRLHQELANAESNLKTAEEDVEKAAIAVAAAEMEPIADELARAENLAATLRRLLLGYGALRHDGGFLPMSCTTAQLLRAPPKNAMVGGNAHCFDATARWASYLQELSLDSEATFEIGP